MSQLRLSDINQLLTTLRVPVTLNAETATQLRQVVSSEAFSQALLRGVEGDEGAKGWVKHNLRTAGLLSPNAPESNPPSSPPSQPIANSAPAKPSFPESAMGDDCEYQEASGHVPAPIPNAVERHPDDASPDQESLISRPSKHVYGGQGALTFEHDTTMSGIPSIAIDAARSNGPRQYDWKNKIRVQLTPQELPIVAAIFLGYKKSCEFMNHGPEKNKGFAFERQDEKIYCKLFSKGSVCGVPILPADIYYVGTLFLGQLQKQSPWLDMTGISMMLRGSSV